MKGIKFEKMHSLGNDFVIIDGFEFHISSPPSFARKYLHRNFGIGGDQLLILLPSKVADVKMRIFNPDGSEAEMCGNGIRCLVDFALRKGYVSGDEVRVETLAGIKIVRKVNKHYRVNMGKPSLNPQTLPSNYTGENPAKIRIEEREIELYLISMGNPHAVTFEALPFEEYAQKIAQKREIFPQGVNVEFAEVCGERELKVKVWERGAGPTLACGTGACATAVAGIVSGKVKSPVDVWLPGGKLVVEWSGEDVVLTGGVERVFEGTLFSEGD
uniref:diaminopimelate epimerase n=1 Tax=uncultured prokaryote TaxID=198431 RepID=H5SPZ5_9ZZZZ|nr:diaminopimelate epimerase [uncultured prokaryote]